MSRQAKDEYRPSQLTGDAPYYPHLPSRAVARPSPEANSFTAVGRTVFVVATLFDVKQMGAREFVYRVYDQKTLAPSTSDMSVMLPSDHTAVIHFGHSEHLMISEEMRRLYVISERDVRMWAIDGYDTTPTLAYSISLDEIGADFINSAMLDVPSDLILILQEGLGGYTLSCFSAATGALVTHMKDLYSRKFIFYPEEYDRDQEEHSKYSGLMLTLDYKSNRVALIVIQTVDASSFWVFDIPYAPERPSVQTYNDMFSHGRRVARPIFSRGRRIALPSIINTADLASSSIILLPDDDALCIAGIYSSQTTEQRYLLYSGLQRRFQDDRPKHHGWTAIARLDVPGGSTFTQYLPHGQSLLVDSSRLQSLMVLSLRDLLRWGTWRPDTHLHFDARTQKAIETVMYIKDAAPGQYWLPPELLFNVFQYL